jgi:hypothetical protein
MTPTRRLVADLVVDHAGNADSAGLRQRFEAFRDIDPVAKDVIVLSDNVTYRFVDRGEQSVKNIARPVRVYAARLEDRLGPRERIATPLHRVTGIAAGLTAVVAVVIAVGAWSLWPATKPAPMPAVTAATSIAQPLTAPRLSIVVLPRLMLLDHA